MKRSDCNLGAILIAIAVAALYGGLVGVGSGAKGHVHTTFAAGEPGDPKSRASRGNHPARWRRRHDLQPRRDRGHEGRTRQVRHQDRGRIRSRLHSGQLRNNAKHVVETDKSPEMDHEWEHNYPNAKRVATNKRAKVHWRFTKAGTFEFACLLPGHFDIGMKGLGHVTDERLSATGTSELW